jgi:diacylglycerol kinase (ATP)
MRIILNPMARHGGGRRLRSGIERELESRRVDFDLVETEGPGHAAELAREAVASGLRTIVAAGGDGTVHEVVNGIASAAFNGVALGLLPIGTGNDSVKMVPGTATMEQAYATLIAGRSAPLDVGVSRWDGGSEYFVNAMGTGIDVEVVRLMRRSRLLPGSVIYVSALIRALARFRPAVMEVVVDGHAVLKRVMNLAVCNGPSIGGSFRICPDASPWDGELDVCLVDEMSMLRNARMVPRVLTGTHVGQPGITMLRGRVVRVSVPAGGPLFFQLDGELRHAADGAAGIEVTVSPRRLNVIRRVAPGELLMERE